MQEYLIQGYSQISILEYTTKKPILYFPEAHVANMKIESSSRIGSGGQQGLDLIGWNSQADGQFLILSPIFSMKFLEIAAGSEIKEQSHIYMEMETHLIENNTIALTNVPVENTEIKVYQLNSSGKLILNEISIDNVDSNIVELTGEHSNWALILYYVQDNVELLDIGKFVNKGYYSIIGNFEIYNNISAEKELLKFEFPKVLINNSFNVKVLNNRNPEEVYILQCQALLEETINKSLLRIIRRIEG